MINAVLRILGLGVFFAFVVLFCSLPLFVGFTDGLTTSGWRVYIKCNPSFVNQLPHIEPHPEIGKIIPALTNEQAIELARHQIYSYNPNWVAISFNILADRLPSVSHDGVHLNDEVVELARDSLAGIDSGFLKADLAKPRLAEVGFFLLKENNTIHCKSDLILALLTAQAENTDLGKKLRIWLLEEIGTIFANNENTGELNVYSQSLIEIFSTHVSFRFLKDDQSKLFLSVFSSKNAVAKFLSRSKENGLSNHLFKKLLLEIASRSNKSEDIKQLLSE